MQFAVVPQPQPRAVPVEAQTKEAQGVLQVLPLAAQLRGPLASPPAPRLMALLAPLAGMELWERPAMLLVSPQELQPRREA